MTDTERQELQAAAVFAGELEVAGMRVRPLTAGSYAALQLIRNPLVTGAEVGDPAEDGEALAAFLEFILAHAAPPERVAELACDRAAFRREALVFGQGVSIAEVAELSRHYETANRQVEAAAVEPAEPGKAPEGPSRIG